MSRLRRGGRSASLARIWFANVKERKNLINCATNKLLAALDIIANKHPSERIMVFSETIESIRLLKGAVGRQRNKIYAYLLYFQTWLTKQCTNMADTFCLVLLY